MTEMDLTQAEGWRPEPGDTLIGRVLTVDKGWSNYGGHFYPIVTVKPESGGAPVAVHCFHQGLMARMRDLRPQQGERIGFHYKGKQPVKSDPSRSVAVYVVKVDGRDADIWDSIPGEPGRSPAPVQGSLDTNADDDIPF